jgi:4-hydroxy-3-methylbut-2-en-1-yl diphosphate reductase
MKEAVAAELAAAYHSSIVEDVRSNDYWYQSGRLTVYLAREFGFCYGVDRAVDYAYQARRRFPDRNVVLTGEIIHNPHVNNRLRAAGIRFLSDPGERWEALGANDVVILPAFGVTVADMARLVDQGCTLVDTTCGSVLNVWKNVVRYAQDGFTAIIHGKVKHEETRATASQALKSPHGRFLVVLDRDEAGAVCDYIRHGGDPDAFLARFATAVSPGFDPDVDLERIGCANQTTMLMSESLEIGEMFRSAMAARYGEEALPQHFRAFDTICSATQERQDAVIALLDQQPLDLMLVVGGYNSSNTCSLARICAERVATYHIAEPECLVSEDELRHRPVGAPSTTVSPESVVRGWLTKAGPLVVGLTAGASTPNNIVGEVIERLARFAGKGQGTRALTDPGATASASPSGSS